MTLDEYCRRLGWNVSELARQAQIDRHTASKALFKGECSSRTAIKIAEALTRGLGKKILVGDIDDLTIKD